MSPLWLAARTDGSDNFLMAGGQIWKKAGLLGCSEAGPLSDIAATGDGRTPQRRGPAATGLYFASRA